MVRVKANSRPGSAVSPTGWVDHPAPPPPFVAWDPAPGPGPARTSSAGPRGGSGDVGELGAQVEDRLGVQLADAALGHAEDAADVGEGQALEVVEADDDLLPLGQLLDRAGEQLPGLSVLGHRLW